jgi:predicted  nucleic acid-binding Zn-ribbon protein
MSILNLNDDRREQRRPRFDDVELGSPEAADDFGYGGSPVQYKRRTRGLWIAFVLLAAFVAAIAVYGYRTAHSQNNQLAWLPNLTKSISSIRERTATLESNLKDWSSKQEKLSATLHNLKAGFASQLRSVREHADQVVAAASQKQSAELNQRTAALKTQIDDVASRQRADQIHMAKLDEKMASQHQELASVKESSNRQIASLQQQQVSTQGQIASINDTLSTDQVNFEAEKKQDTEIVPGVSLHLTGTDISHQRYAAWVWLAGSRRRIWVRSQTIETPLVFYPKDGGEAYELVVTRVNPRDIAGYMLVPSDSNAGGTASAANHKPAMRPASGGM